MEVEVLKPEKSASEIRYNSIKRKCTFIFKLTPENTPKKLIPKLERTMNHLNKLLYVLGEHEIIDIDYKVKIDLDTFHSLVQRC